MKITYSPGGMSDHAGNPYTGPIIAWDDPDLRTLLNKTFMVRDDEQIAELIVGGNGIAVLVDPLDTPPADG